MFPPAVNAIVRKEALIMAAAIGLAILAGVLELAPHTLVATAAYVYLGDGGGADASSTLTVAVVLTVVAILLRFGAMGGSLVLSHQASFRLARRLRLAMGERLTRAPMPRVVRMAPGDLKKAFMDDAAAVGGILEHSIPDVTSAVVVPVLSVGLLFALDWRMALASLSLLPLGVLVVFVVMSGMGDGFTAWQKIEQRANDAIVDFLRGIVVLKTFDREARSMHRLSHAIFGIRDAAVGMTQRSTLGYTGFMVLFSTNLVVLLPLGLWFLQQGSLDVPTLFTFVVFGTGVTAPMLKLLFLFGNMQMSQTRLARIEAVLTLPDIESHAHPGTSMTAPDGDLQVDGLSFRYDDGRPLVLDGVRFDAQHGTRVAIVGPSGAGKSTLARMLVGDWEPAAGRVTVGNVDLATLSKETRGRLIGFVGQQTFLLRASLRDNLRLGATEATDAEIEDALRLAGVADVVAALPDGLDTHLGPDGGGLSGGERQRLAIARTALQGPRILILDEATAHLDPLAEAKVREGLDRLMEGRTTLVVAHRLRSIKDADRIVVMNEGRVADQGTHDVLLERCPVYRDLWERQEQATTWRLGGRAPVAAPSVTGGVA